MIKITNILDLANWKKTIHYGCEHSKQKLYDFIIKNMKTNQKEQKTNIQTKTLQLSYKELSARYGSLTGYKIDNFIILSKLGQGSFGSVFCCFDDITKKLFAAKVIDLKIIQKQIDPDIKQIKRRLAKTQSSIMIKCDSQNLIKCYQVYENKQLKIMIIQYCQNGSLQQKIQKYKKIPQYEAIQILKQILNGLSQLHKNGIIHRDLKPQNILIHDGVYKIADFGFSKDLQSNNYKNQITRTNLGTLFTMAPQIIEGKKYGLQADIWSVGVIFYTMIFGKFPYQKVSRKDLINQIKTKDIFYTNNYNKDVVISEMSKQFILQCLNIDPQKRFNWQNIVNHKLFKNQQNQFNFSTVSLSTQSSIQSSNKTNISLNIANINKIDYSLQGFFKEQNILEKQKQTKISQLVRANLIRPQQLRKKQQQAKDIIQNLGYPWTKVTHFQILRIEFIMDQIFQNLEYCPSKFSQSRQIVQILYLIIARCFEDISFKYWRKQQKKDKMIFAFLEKIQNVYKNVEKKFDIYLQKILARDNELIEVFKSKLSDFFNDQQLKQKSTYLIGNKSNTSKCLCLGNYNRRQQIKFTQRCINLQLNKISKQQNFPTNSLKYLKMYQQICNLTLKQVGQIYFRTYVTNLFLKL